VQNVVNSRNLPIFVDGAEMGGECSVTTQLVSWVTVASRKKIGTPPSWALENIDAELLA